MIQVYADGVLAYDSRLEESDLQGLTITSGLNKGGTAVVTMPPGHPAYDFFTSYKTIVEVYRDDVLLFRGRALYPVDDFHGVRAVTCEGEFCFFQDAVSRPYLYQAAPASVFTDVVAIYNSQANQERQFRVGTVTVTDANDYIRLESETAETVMDTVNKLLERCGGYIVFTTDDDGARVVNWYESLPYRSGQVIEFGENLLNFSRTGANTALITAVLPYGAKDETTGQPITIESVNDGLDYIKDDEAVALRGFIIRAVTWDDVTEPVNLKRKAQQYLEQNRYIVTSLELTALDLHYLDKSIDSFQVGDQIRVQSKPHAVDEDFLLTDHTDDLLNPANSTITLGKDKRTLTGADVAGDNQNRSELHKTAHNIRADYTQNIASAVQETKQTLSSLIQQTSQEIRLEVSETYATNGEVESLVSTQMVQLSDRFDFLFDELQKVVDANDQAARDEFETIQKYIRFVDGNIVLGESSNELTLKIENDRIGFLDAGAEVAYFSDKQLYVTDAHFLNSLRLGKFAWLPRENGNLSLVKVGD